MKTAKSADFSDMVKLISHSADETEQIGEKIAKKLHGTEVIALFGGLGMGKTALQEDWQEPSVLMTVCQALLSPL